MNWINEMNKSEKFWDRMSKNFDDQEKADDKVFVRARKYLNRSDTVLDYACATGMYTLEAAGHVKEIHGIDQSSKMIEVAKRNADERKAENVTFRQATIFDGSHPEESYDVILAFNILHLLQEIPEVVRRINELLKPGGLFISASACLGENGVFVGTLITLLGKTGLVPQVNLFKSSELKAFITGGDFQIVELEKITDSVSHYFIVARKI